MRWMMSTVNPLSTLDIRQPTSASILVLPLQFLRDPTQKRIRNKGAPTKHAVFQTISPFSECSSLVLRPFTCTTISLSPLLFCSTPPPPIDIHALPCPTYTTTKQATKPGHAIQEDDRSAPLSEISHPDRAPVIIVIMCPRHNGHPLFPICCKT